VQEVWVYRENQNPIVVRQESDMIVVHHKQRIVRKREASRRSNHGVSGAGGLGAEKGLADYGARGLAGKKIGCGAGH
jgi:hypothetical protein